MKVIAHYVQKKSYKATRILYKILFKHFSYSGSFKKKQKEISYSLLVKSRLALETLRNFNQTICKKTIHNRCTILAKITYKNFKRISFFQPHAPSTDILFIFLHLYLCPRLFQFIYILTFLINFVPTQKKLSILVAFTVKVALSQ